MNKDKVDELVAKGKTALAKGKTVLDEIKTNFKADEGAVGFKKFKSRFFNLWKSGITGKGALIASITTILILIYASVGSNVSKIRSLEEEYRDISTEICDLYDILGKGNGDLSAAIFCAPGRALTEIEDEIRDFKKLSSKEQEGTITMYENLVKQFKEHREKIRSECKDKKIKYNGDSPLRVAKKFVLCWRAKDGKGMGKLLYGEDIIKEKMVEALLKKHEDPSAISELFKLECLGTAYYNGNKNKAGVAIEDERKNVGITGDYSGMCVSLIKTDHGWLVDAKEPFRSCNKITSNLMPDGY